MKLKILVILVFLFFNITTKAQNSELGKVTIADLEQKLNPADSSAVATILFSKGIVKIGSDGSSESIFQRRIKIYKKEGYEWSDVQVTFPAGKSSNLSITDVYTYNLINGKMVKSKLKEEGAFIDKTNKRYWIKKITFPDVKEGSILEYKVRKQGGLYIEDWNFQEDIPVNYSEFRTIIPDAVSFKKNVKGFYAPKVTNQIANTYGYMARETIYVVQNLTAMKDEDFVSNVDNYRSGISHEIESIQVPGQFSHSFSTDWPTVVKTIYQFEDFGPELNKTGYFEDDLNLLLKAKVNPDEKIKAIFDYVKSTVKWNNYVGYECDKGVRKAYKEKTGNCADINLMLTAMLRYADLKANPVLISTRSNGIPFFPTINAFNYVITSVETPTGNVLLDATDKFSTIGILPLRDLNWTGRLIRKDGTSDEVDLVPKKMSSDLVTMCYDIDQKGEVLGKIRRQYSEYTALEFRNIVDEEKEDVYLEKLENENNKIEISDYKRTSEKELLLPILETFSFAGTNLSEVIGEKIYITPMLFLLEDKNPFKQEVREYPVDFGYPFLDKYNITIQIPEGFVVETLPAPAILNMEDNLGSFKFNIAANGNALQLSIAHQINEAIVSTEKYEMLKEYYKGMIAKETEKIVLKRI
ncbi:DUF3857 domain-containing protein [Flavobacterium pectinovorum]|uniref:DUF3857 domain-containing protein n=1 Tax=Flavobacterium pectinovorum TaxID=29533 RepID=A0A502EM93_9FLAO|nr:DUF3857 domain-containing protein [Flavobacterium pectinovorum]TPG38875.1 DUF3857 domain-containing protein [Flavobacterium pectinovorum]